MLVNPRIVGCAILLGLTALCSIAAAQPVLTNLYAPGSATPLVLGAGGVLYGVGGGQIFPECPDGCGGIFALTPPATAGGPWTETTIYSFTSVQDGIGGNALIKGASGGLYGITGFGGTGCKGQGCGTVFLLNPPAETGAPWTKATYAFTGPNLPNSLVLSNGVLYGTSRDGGAANFCFLGCGTFFSVTPPSASQHAWSQRVLYSFSGSSDLNPVMVIPGGNGEFFGTAGGSGGCPAECGYVFSMTQATPSSPWKETVLYTDTATSSPNNFLSLVAGSGGIIYGTTTYSGAHGYGSVFSLTPPSSTGGTWTETTLYSFTSVPDAAQPNPGLLIGPGGVLYGTTYTGGVRCQLTPAGCGTIFSLTPPASTGGAWTEKVLYAFTDGNDGAWPTTGLTSGHNGVLYGSTSVGPALTPGGFVFSFQP